MIIDNVKAAYFSPHFWWKGFDRAIEMTTNMVEELNPDFNFKKWLYEAKIEHDSTQICMEEGAYAGINAEYSQAIRNDYFFEVSTKSEYGHTVTAKTIEALFTKSGVKKGSPVSYVFRLEDLHGFVSMYLQSWLLTNSYYDWVRWQLYFDFIVAKLDHSNKGSYIYMWSIVLGGILFEDHLFKDVKQYKNLRDKKDDFDKESAFFENQFIAKRDKENKSKP